MVFTDLAWTWLLFLRRAEEQAYYRDQSYHIYQVQ